ncbi:MAG: hypothetical protein O7D95_06495 [Betaproteobacteria bacterium]|nr:hypothetical protein [Betaproteobacteria bacterium]
MPKSLVRKFMREGLTEKQAEAKTARITNAQKKKRKIKPRKRS